MTAASVSSGGHDDGPEWRDKLAGALNGTAHLGCEEFSPDDADSGCPDCEDVFRAADALLPVVAGIVAGELRAAAERADTWSRLSPPGDAQDAYAHVHDATRARADEIDPA